MDEAQETLKSWGLKPFVAKQLFEWVYKKNESDYQKMTNISKKDREILTEKLDIHGYKNVQSLEDKQVTVRDRDTMAQERIPLDNLKTYLTDKLSN